MMTPSNKPLSEVLNAFALAMPTPDARILENFVRRYPEHADALTEFAIELALGVPSEEEGDEDIAPATGVSPAVANAISHIHNVAFQLEQQAGNAPAAVPNPLAGMSREEFRSFADHLGVNTTFSMKMRDRTIEPQTIIARKGFCQTAADAARVPLNVMVAHFQAPPMISAHAHYKANDKPAAVARESFEDAVRNSNLSEEQQRKILAL